MIRRKILTPCPPKKHCAVCAARLNEVFGSHDKTAKYEHQAGEAGQRAKQLLIGGAPFDYIRPLVLRAAAFANLALGATAEV